MHPTIVGMGIVLLVALVIFPGSAFTLDTLQISVMNDGGADISLNYTLTFWEDIAVFFRVVDPAKEIQQSIEQSTGKTAQVEHANTRSAEFTVQEYATPLIAENTITQTTPRLDFTQADQYIKNQWWSFLVSQDLSPAISTIIFSDGYTRTFQDELEIPSITHILTR